MTSSLSPAELTQQLESLESRLAYQEHWLDTLDQAVAQQERRLATLEQLSALMRERLREQHQELQAGDDTGGSRPEDDIPPHY
ncbi:SlyX family protein [Halomonas sp. HL-93]|uniref:SlyX family protein n=1 Tax=Halomonas sp. HL-93 TaxID=1666906 RepID=UPI0006DAF26C|nr:SlyX family protein [Halomonas sp. HL-93]KPQ23116.1 MAG: SlyX protein [Halomonas sp. HL-93]SBR51391.1 SlyX protein [Halomonas sp. HL-93]